MRTVESDKVGEGAVLAVREKRVGRLDGLMQGVVEEKEGGRDVEDGVELHEEEGGHSGRRLRDDGSTDEVGGEVDLATGEDFRFLNGRYCCNNKMTSEGAWLRYKCTCVRENEGGLVGLFIECPCRAYRTSIFGTWP